MRKWDEYMYSVYEIEDSITMLMIQLLQLLFSKRLLKFPSLRTVKLITLNGIITITIIKLATKLVFLKEYATIRVECISVPRGGTSSRYLISQLRLSRYKYSASNSVRSGSLRYGVQSTELKSWWNIIGGEAVGIGVCISRAHLHLRDAVSGGYPA